MKKALRSGISPRELFDLPVKEEITRMRYLPEDRLEDIEAIKKKVTSRINDLVEGEQTA